MRRLPVPVVLALSVALACGDSGSGTRDPYVAAPVAAGVVGSSTFLQRVPVQDGDLSFFPDAANYWDLYTDLSLSDGSDDQFDGALHLRVGTVPTKPATWTSLDSEAIALTQFPSDQAYTDFTFFEPTFGTASLKLADVMASAEAYQPVLAGTYSAYVAPTGDSRLQQTVDLTAATGTVTLGWVDAASSSAGSLTGFAPIYRVVIRSATTGAVLETAVETTSTSGAHSFDLTPYAGQRVVLSFEYRSTWGYAQVDSVSITDGDATEFVANGDFEAGDLTGWTAATGGQSQNLVGAPRTVGGLDVTRGFYADPSALWARWVDVFENTGAAPVTTDVVYLTNLGSDGAGIIYDTPGAAGRAITSWDGMGYDRDVALVYGTGQALFQSNPNIGTWAGGQDDVYVLHTITVPAGGSVAIVQYVLMSGLDTGSLATTLDATARAVEMDAAAAAVATGVGNNPGYLDWMTTDQRAATIANW